MKKVFLYFKFDKMVSLTILKIIYILGIAGLIVWTIDYFIKGGLTNIVAGVLVLIFGNLIWRVFCELLIVLFSIQDLAKKNEGHLKIISSSIRE